MGIISFNETVFKELLDIAVITTDSKEMGRTTAQMILSGEVKQVKNYSGRYTGAHCNNEINKLL